MQLFYQHKGSSSDSCYARSCYARSLYTRDHLARHACPPVEAVSTRHSSYKIQQGKALKTQLV